MVKGSDKRRAEFPIHPLLLDRWSQRSMTGEAVSDAELMTLFEAARWAPSSGNGQPWRILFARAGTPHFQTFFNLLFDGNKPWAAKAGALLVLVSDTLNPQNGQSNPNHSFDMGAAWQNMALQAWASGLAIHGIGGFDRAKARELLAIPERFQVDAMVVVGKPGPVETLPEAYKPRETPNDRRPVAQSICEGVFSFPTT